MSERASVLKVSQTPGKPPTLMCSCSAPVAMESPLYVTVVIWDVFWMDDGACTALLGLVAMECSEEHVLTLKRHVER